MLLLCIFVLFHSVSSEVSDLDVKHIVEVITHYQEEVVKYNRPQNAYSFKPTDETILEYGTFDYIIVGAGSSGAVLATRLSENDNATVLLLEAGGEETTFSDIPAMIMHLFGTELNWNYKTVPQSNCCLGMVDRQCSHPRGKGLGGSSIINAAMYVRGNKDDFDSWLRAGNKGWSYQEVLPYFIKSENSQIDGDPGYHGKGGLLNVEYRRPVSPVTESFIKAHQELGLRVVDYNGREQLGVSRTQFSTINGQRQSTGKAFLSKSRYRKNLHVLTHSYVKRVLIDDKKSASGVSFDHGGQSYIAKVNKDVILSAGAIGSPHILMHSGIGPSKVLTPLGVPLVHDLPVGANYQDHPTIFTLFFKTNYSEPIKTLHEYSKDYLNGLGGLTIGANAQALAFLRTKLATTPKGVPDVEIIINAPNATNDYFKQAFNYDDETYNTLFVNQDVPKICGCFLMLLHPKSRGSISLRSSDPYDYPDIDLNFYSDKLNHDIETMYEGIKKVLEMLETTAFKQLDAKLLHNVLPACSSYEYLSKEQWLCQIRHLTAPVYHPVGTCKMAPYSKHGVVDHRLKVHGIEKLRVCDTSVFPKSTSGHPNAPAIMIAEKLADMLKNE